MATQSRIGGLQTGTPSTVAPNLKGPTTGGYIVFPFLMRIAGTASTATIDGIVAPTDLRVISFSIAHILTGDASSGPFLRNGTTQFTSSASTPSAPAYHIGDNEGTVGSNTYAVNRGWNQTVGALTAIEGQTARNFTRGTVMDMRVAGTGALSFSYAIHAFCTVRGHRYDPDNTATPSLDDFPYKAAND